MHDRLLTVALSAAATFTLMKLDSDGSGEHQYALIAVSTQGRRTAVSPTTRATGLARLRWENVPGADV